MTNGSTPITATNTIGPLTLGVTIPATGNYGDTAVLTATLQTVTIGNNQLTPSNNQWTTSGEVGTTKYQLAVNYAPPTAATLGDISVVLTVTVQGQSPQTYSGTAFSWTSDGKVLIPPTS